MGERLSKTADPTRPVDPETSILTEPLPASEPRSRQDTDEGLPLRILGHCMVSIHKLKGMAGLVRERSSNSFCAAFTS